MSEHASGATLDLIGIVPLILDISDYTFTHSFIILKKLKQPLIIGLDFAQCYKTGVDWDTYGTLFLKYKGRKITTALR